MLEDVAGVQSAGTTQRYFTCPECGQVFRQSEARTTPNSLDDDGHSEFQVLCPQCERLDMEGERPLLPADDH